MADAERKEQSAAVASGEVREQRTSMPDPWGVKRAENLLTSLQGILSERVVVSPIGEVTEVHVLTHGGLNAKQVVRNVESALLAQLGLKVDHRRISVAQTAEVKPIEALERSAVREEALKRGIVFDSLELQPLGGRRLNVVVRVRPRGGEVIAGEARGADTPKARVQAAARAALAAVERIMDDAAFELEGVKLIEAFESMFAFAGVHLVEGRTTQLLAGTCEVGDQPEQAAALAVLDALNRWIESRRPR